MPGHRPAAQRGPQVGRDEHAARAQLVGGRPAAARRGGDAQAEQLDAAPGQPDRRDLAARPQRVDDAALQLAQRELPADRADQRAQRQRQQHAPAAPRARGASVGAGGRGDRRLHAPDCRGPLEWLHMPDPAAPDPATTRLLGVDFTSAPTRRKPITLAHGHLARGLLRFDGIECAPDFDAFSAALCRPGPWLGVFDLPFGLPRALVEALGWPRDWGALMQHYAALSRAEIRASFAAFCAARPAGAKFAHRACDGPAGSSPSMKWVNPPVAYMLHAGVPRLLAAGVALPGLHAGDASRVALEGYPGLLARELIGARSYKSDERAKQTPERLIARKDLVDALEQGRTRLGVRVKLRHAQRDELVADASGDRLDALLCLVQAAWASAQPGHGLPPQVDALEGWITSAPWRAAADR